jgi:hypothetical protein
VKRVLVIVITHVLIHHLSLSYHLITLVAKVTFIKRFNYSQPLPKASLRALQVGCIFTAVFTAATMVSKRGKNFYRRLNTKLRR